MVAHREPHSKTASDMGRHTDIGIQRMLCKPDDLVDANWRGTVNVIEAVTLAKVTQ